MKKLIMAMILVCCTGLLSGCATQSWKCYADLNRDSKCKPINCEDVGNICKQGKYRVLKIYSNYEAFVYSTDPLTDLSKCR